MHQPKNAQLIDAFQFHIQTKLSVNYRNFWVQQFFFRYSDSSGKQQQQAATTGLGARSKITLRFIKRTLCCTSRILFSVIG